MASRIHWSDLKTGVAAVAVIAVVVVSILLFARVGKLHGKTTRLYVTAPDVTGVLAGTDVWLAGKKVGRVKDVRFLPVTADTLQRVLIETDILVDNMPLIRKNSRADIRPGGTLIGSPVVYLKPGTLAAPPLKEGDTVRSRSSSRIAAVGLQVDTLIKHLTSLADSSGSLIDKLGDQSNTVGALRTRGVQQLRSMSAVASSFSDRATVGSGTLGLAHRGALGARIGRVIAAKDSIALLVSSGNGNIGRFRRDSTLLRKVASVRAGFDSLRALMSTPGSGVTRLRSDTTLKSEIARGRAQLDSLMREIKKHPFKYISF
ncbi:MAG TPA: MlaD family protein [Gemmatimonadaceae bacterium]